MSNASVPALPQHEATLLLAPLIVGYQLQIASWGITFTTFARYITSARAKEDHIFCRCYVSFVMLLDTIVTGLVMTSGVRKAVAQHRDPEWFVLASVNKLDDVSSAMGLPIGILARAFLARRAFLYARKPPQIYAMKPSRIYAWLFAALFAFLTVLEIFGAVAGRTKRANEIARAPGRQSPSAWIIAHGFTIAFFSSAIVDIAISGTLAWRWIQLLRSRSELHSATRTKLRKMTSFTLATASYTAVFATSAAIIWAAVPGTFWLIFAIPSSGLYTLSLFTTLEFRAAVDARSSINPGPVSVTLPPQRRPSQRTDSSDGAGVVWDEEAGGIRVTREVDQKMESVGA